MTTNVGAAKDWKAIAGVVLRVVSALPPGHQLLVKFDGERESRLYTVMLFGSESYYVPGRDGDDLEGMLRIRLAMLPAGTYSGSEADESRLAEVLALCEHKMTSKAVVGIDLGRDAVEPTYSVSVFAPWTRASERAADLTSVVDIVYTTLMA